MLTECQSIIEIGKERINEPNIKLVPSFKFKCCIQEIETNITVIIPNYKYAAVRLICEFIDGIRLDEFLSDYFSQVILKIKEINSFNLDVKEFNLPLEILAKSREQLYYECGYQEAPEISVDVIQTLISYVAVIGGGVFFDKDIKELKGLKYDWELDLRDLTSLSNSMDKSDRFLKEYNSLSNPNEYCCILSERVIYPEDIYNTPEISLQYHNSYTGNLFSQYRTLKDVLSVENLTVGQQALISRTHCTCGGDLVIHLAENDGYTTLHCINPYCYHKMTWSLAGLIKDIGFTGVGAKKLLISIHNLWFSNVIIYGKSEVRYMDIISDKFKNYLGGSLGSTYSSFLLQLKNYSNTIEELIKICNLPYVGEYASKVIKKNTIFSINCFSDFAKICRGSSIVSYIVMYRLYSYIEDIKHLINFTKCCDSNMLQYKICITRSVYLRLNNSDKVQKLSKSEFVQILNNYLEKHDHDHSVRIVLSKNMSHDVKILINDTNFDGNKVNYAKKHGIPIYSSNQVLSVIKGVLNSE